MEPPLKPQLPSSHVPLVWTLPLWARVLSQFPQLSEALAECQNLREARVRDTLNNVLRLHQTCRTRCIAKVANSFYWFLFSKMVTGFSHGPSSALKLFTDCNEVLLLNVRHCSVCLRGTFQVGYACALCHLSRPPRTCKVHAGLWNPWKPLNLRSSFSWPWKCGNFGKSTNFLFLSKHCHTFQCKLLVTP